MKKNLVKAILYVLGILAIVLIIINTDWKEVYVHIRSLPLKFILLLLLAQCITIFLLTLQWKSMAFG